ncbi:MAG: exonuclease SbcCD subunit D [Candidatus Tectomicrobia bacterium]|uniref:Nuclease SbcCD subunit D n=1 Tax=Tectimicrobiota bacterium TaxID=2528274 RepID=A0A937W2M3_UNCTE|nr:exonuclease SbcCD subunit D [Candidatus Tectomicrobia bacterium]
MALRLFHTADVHFGMENYGRLDPATGLNRRLLDFTRSMHYAIDYAIEHDVHLAIFAGDIYKHRDPDPSWQRAFAQCVRRLTDATVPVVILVGNHDIPNTTGKAHAVEIFATLGLPGVTVIAQPALHFIDTAVGRVQVAGFPYITRSFLLSRDEFKEHPIEDINRVLVEKAEEILRQFAAQVDPAFPAILTLHGSVANAILSSEQSIMMVGHDPIIPLSALTNPAWDYVALGHIHRHQDLHQGAQPPVVYSGSIERIDFGEERETKGFVLAQVEKGHTTYAFIPTPARRFVTLRIDTQQGDPLQLLDQALAAHDVKDAVVRVILTVAPEYSDMIDERQIRERLREAYLLAGIIKEEIKAPVRSRDSELTEVLGPLQAVERYIVSHPEYSEHQQALLERAQRLLRELQEELLV